MLNIFIKFESYLSKGEYEDAKLYLESVTIEDQVFKKILYGKLLGLKGQFKESYLHLLNLSKEFKIDNINEIGRLASLGYVQFRLGKVTDCLISVKKGLDLIEAVDNKDNFRVRTYKGTLYHLKATCLADMGKLKDSLEVYEKALLIRKNLDNLKNIASTLNNLGVTYWYLGDPNKSLDYYKMSLDYYIKLQSSKEIGVSLLNIGEIYQRKGDLSRALEFYESSLRYKENSGDKQSIAITLEMIGRCYRSKKDNELGIKYLKQAYQLHEEIGNPNRTSETLFHLILASEGNLEELNYYMNKLEHLQKEHNNQFIELRFKLAKALEYKFSKRAKNILKAQLILEEITNQSIDNELNLISKIHLCEILILELRAFNDESIFGELTQLIDEIQKLGEVSNSYPILVESYILKTKLALINGEVKQADELLLKAYQICEEYGLTRLKEKIINEQEKLQSEINNWINIMENSSNLIKRVEQSNILEYLQIIGTSDLSL